jgi:hypothetical protein
MRKVGEGLFCGTAAWRLRSPSTDCLYPTENNVFILHVKNLDKDTLNLYTPSCIELGIATSRRLSLPV